MLLTDFYMLCRDGAVLAVIFSSQQEWYFLLLLLPMKPGTMNIYEDRQGIDPTDPRFT